VWEDPTLAEWPENDFRIHIGNLGPEVDDKVLHDAFKKYSTLAHWKVIRDKKYDLSKGFGFLSFLDPREGVKVLKEMNNKYVGQRPCKLQKSAHDKRNYSGPQDKSKKHR
jgi:RNA recognition motif-containing protein